MSKKKGVNWDLNSFFREFNGPEMLAFKEKLFKDIEKLQKKASKMEVLSDKNADEWEKIILQAEDFITRADHLESYVECIASANAANEEYKSEGAVIARIQAEYEKFDVDIQRAFKEASKSVFQKFISRKKLKEINYFLERIKERAQKTMSRQEEIIAADLNVDGLHSWGRLYDTITGKLEFDMKMPDGKVVRKPISQWRSLMSDADFKIGKAAFEGGNTAWRSIEDVCAAALNAIAGTRLTLYKYRGIDHYLDRALFSARIKKETLDAMYKAIHDNIEVGREIFKIKSKFNNQKGIWFFEREAPIPLESAKLYSWDEGRKMVEKAFGTAYPTLKSYYVDFINKKWIESEVKPGKRPGAFCTGSPLTKEQRVYMTFNGSLGDVTTLAHEVGHAFHGHLMKEMRTFAKGYPMTLAETASIFAEHILAEGIYTDDSIDDDQKLLMLDADMCGAGVLLLDITTRFEFEKKFHEERQKGEVSVSRLKQLMVETQKKVFGEAMIKGGEDEMFWASKLHFYITQVTFYNFPYTFGFLLARAIYNMFKKEGPTFLPKYENFLRLTGSDTVENVARKTLGVDISKPKFWAKSIQSMDSSLKLYRKLLSKRKK